MSWWERPIWALDLETNGVDPHTAEVVQFAIARVTPSGRVLESQTAIVKTEGWSVEAERVHGVTREESELGVSRTALTTLLRRALARLDDGPLAVFNAGYDLTILHRLGVSVERVTVLDPLVLDRHAHRYRRGSRKLGAVYAHYTGEVLNGAHDALSDAVAAARLAFALAERHEQLRVPSRDLHSQQVTWAAEQAASLQAHFRKSNPQAVVDGQWPVRRGSQA